MVRKLASISVWVAFATIAIATLTGMPSAASAEQLRYSVELSVDDIVVDDKGGIARIGVNKKDFDQLAEPGLPELPYRVISFLLPQGEGVESFEFVASSAQKFSAPSPMILASDMLSEDGKTGSGEAMAGASAAGVFPETLGRYVGTGYLHGRAVASFAVFPFHSDNGQLYFHESVDVAVTTAPVAMENVVVRERFREGFNEKVHHDLARVVVNPEMNANYDFNEVKVEKKQGGFQPTSYPSLEGSAVDYLIITTDALAGDLQRLADFKTRKGVPTVVRTVEWIEANTRNGVDLQETMRFFVRDAYQKWGITYLLLGGDTDVIPARFAMSRFYLGGTQVPVDMYFSCLDGTWNDNHDKLWGEAKLTVPLDNPDLWSEVYNGRIPISDPTDLNALIDKIITYENATNPAYMDTYLYLAEVLFPVDWTQGFPVSLNGADFTEFLIASAMSSSPMALTRMYETEELYPGSVNESAAEAIAALNLGYNHVNHIGHGFRFNLSVADRSILNDDADALTNTGKPFNLYMLNCTAAAFNFFCLAEHFLQNNNGGAVSVIGANESAFPNASSNYMDEYNTLVFDEDVVHIGEAFARSRLPRTPVADMGDNVDLWTHYIYSILADPEMPFFNGPVQTLDVFHVSNVPVGPSNVLVNVTSNSNPVDSAVVCLTKDDEDYVVGVTNSLGNVILDFTAESPGSISVVVTALNSARSQTWITVDAIGGAYISFAGLTIDDDNAGGTTGNGDGVVDAGETIDFIIDVKNTGGVTANGVSLKLRSSDPDVTVTDSTATIGTVATSSTVAAADPVTIQFGSNIADEVAVEFALETTDGIDTWNDAFKKVVHSPALEVIGLRIDDSGFGNGDGVPQDGELFLLYAEVKNYGTGTANGLNGTVTDPGSAFTITTGASTYPDLTPLSGAENDTGFFMSETNTLIPSPLVFTLTDNFGRSLIDTLELRAPLPPDSLLFQTTFGPDRLLISWQQSTSLDVTHYNVYRSLTQGGPYVQANADPIEHAVYEDRGLAGTTRYYYVTTAVDAAGNESVQSNEFSASTNPAQMSGFPIIMEGQTPSSPAVGDIDGDGDLEIVVGNEQIYAWHHSGQEIQDGDSDPQTWGVLNTLGDEFAAPVALAHIDGNPGMEIIAADLFTSSVYVVDGQGNALPGWPQIAQNGFRAAPVVGDIDGDYDPEIIAVDEAGIVYAWHHDGSEVRDGDSDGGTQGVFYVTPATSVHFMAPALADIDGDGRDEIVLATRGGLLHVFNDDGSEVTGFPKVLAGEVVGAPVVGDVDNNGTQNILVRARTSHVYLFENDGSPMPGWPRFVALHSVFFAYATMALADVDGNNTLETIMSYHSGQTSRIYIIQHNGADFPGWPLTYTTADKFSESCPTVADVNGDGMLDIILGDESRLVYAWDLTGALIPGWPLTTEDAIRATPHFDDLDGDGDIDMVLHSWDQNIYVYDIPAPYVKELVPWGTFQGNVNRTGQYGDFIATAIGNASFSFNVSSNGVDLTWLFGSPDAFRYDLERAAVDNGMVGNFSRVASDLRADRVGVIRFADAGARMGDTYVYRLQSRADADDLFESGHIYIPINRAQLGQNYPNPFNPTTTIRYFVPEGVGAQNVSLIVYDVSGARVRTLVNGVQTAGRFEIDWDGRNNAGDLVGSGVYFYRLALPNFVDTRKMILLK